MCAQRLDPEVALEHELVPDQSSTLRSRLAYLTAVAAIYVSHPMMPKSIKRLVIRTPIPDIVHLTIHAGVGE